jgi:hypothetical protein
MPMISLVNTWRARGKSDTLPEEKRSRIIHRVCPPSSQAGCLLLLLLLLLLLVLL